MTLKDIEPKLSHDCPLELGNSSFLPGESGTSKIRVGKLPTDTTIHITAKVHRSKNPGPTVLIIGGIHGDEINGIQIVRQAILEETFDNITSGTVIAIPLLNVFGFINFSREVPDGKDINRSFPGSKKGSLASRVAYTLTNQILPYVDIIMDFHTGGNFIYNYPQVRYFIGDQLSDELAKTFNAKFLVQKPLISNSLRKIASGFNIPTMVFEGGESVRLDGFIIENGLKGMRNVLFYLDMINEKNTLPLTKAIVCTATKWIRAQRSGVYIWTKSSGNLVKKGEILGTIGDPSGDNSYTVKASTDGHIIGHNNASVVNQGDALFHIAYGYE